MLVGLPMSTAVLLKKQIQYRYSHGIGELSISSSVNFLVNKRELKISVLKILTPLQFE